MINAGLEVDPLILRELGLPWESTQQSMLSVRSSRRESQSERKKSEDYLTLEAELTAMRKADTERGRKDQCYDSVGGAIKHKEEKRVEKENQLQERKRARSEGNVEPQTKKKKYL